MKLNGRDKYNPSEIEEKWQKIWQEKKIYSPNLDSGKKPFGSAQGKPFYNLMMFPYPSAEGMHVGNMYAFTGSDIYGRFKRMQGFSVFEPIGLDGFGIHSENYAIKVGCHPKEQAKISEANFYRQLHATGNGFDWGRTVETYDPNYYKWTQWIFIQLFKAGLAYRKKASVNFCPSCKTVLADEQVVAKSKIKNQKSKISLDLRSNPRSSAKENLEEVGVNVCERCETEVERKELEQWFFKITTYADRLLNNLKKLDWTAKVKIAQENWIGRSEGTRIEFRIKNSELRIQVFTTRADTLYGATFLVLSPEHPIAASIKEKKVQDYIKEAKRKTEAERIGQDREKTGVFTGLYAINPLNNEKIPIWIADYAIMGFGTGALFGDAHDERDVEFAKKYKIPLKPTIKTGDKEKDKRIRNLEECYTGYGTLFDSGQFSGLTSKDAIKKITEWLTKEGTGGKKTTYHLRDWLISRQRYWGPPIPMVYCKSCAKAGKSWFTTQERLRVETGSLKLDKEARSSKLENNLASNFQPQDQASSLKRLSSTMLGWYPEENLPVLLPDVKDWRPEGSGKSPLANHPEFYKTKCPDCGGEARRETDASDTFLDSAWYFFRYLATDRDDVPFPSEAFSNSKSQIPNSKQIQNSNDQKIGAWNLELDAYSSRVKRWLPVNMYIGGAEHSVLHLLYSRFLTMVFKDLGLISFEEPFTTFRAHGLLISGGAKMSKSKGNVVIPDQYIKKYGADTLRTYLMFAGPFEQGGDFRDTGIEGMFRFLNRVWTLSHNVKRDSSSRQGGTQNDIKRVMHKTIKNVTEDIQNLRYNTAIAHIMEYYNEISKIKDQISKIEMKEHVKILVLLLAPFAPHMTEELFHNVILSEAKDLVNKRDSSSRQGGTQNDKWRSIHQEPWPSYDPKMLEEDEATIVIQVNGKLRDTIKDQRSKIKDQSYVEKKARERERVKKYLEGKTVKKVVYVEGKIINFVIE